MILYNFLQSRICHSLKCHQNNKNNEVGSKWMKEDRNKKVDSIMYYRQS